MVVAEVTNHEFGLQPSSGNYSVGQIIAIVVSGATILRAIWCFQCLFNGDEESRRTMLQTRGDLCARHR